MVKQNMPPSLQQSLERVLRFFENPTFIKSSGLLERDRVFIRLWFVAIGFFKTGPRGVFFLVLTLLFLRSKAPKFPIPSSKSIAYLPTKNDQTALKYLKKYQSNEDWLSAIKLTQVMSFKERLVLARYIWQKKITPELHAILDRSPSAYATHNLILCVIFYFAALKQLEGEKPDNMIIANDHTGDANGILAAAKDQNISTIYIQHASISELFPPLIFDTAYLFDQQTFEIYKNISKAHNVEMNTNCIIYDRAKDRPTKPNEIQTPFSICIYLPTIFVHSALRALVTALGSKSNVDKIYLILHPRSASARAKIHRLFPHLNILIGFEEGKEIQNSLAIIGNSSVFLELRDAGVPTYYYPQLDEIEWDYYGYVRQGDLTEIKDIEALSTYIS